MLKATSSQDPSIFSSDTSIKASAQDDKILCHRKNRLPKGSRPEGAGAERLRENASAMDE